MRQFSLLSSVLLFSASFASCPGGFAQPTPRPAVAGRVMNIMGESCPVDLQAQRNGMPVVVATKGQPIEAVQRLRLSWTNRLQKEIVAAAILVHGFDSAARIIPAAGAGSHEMRKTYAVRLNVSGEGRATSDLTVQRFANVSSIELKSIEYADGSRWIASAGESCRIAPNPLLLVAATASR